MSATARLRMIAVEKRPQGRMEALKQSKAISTLGSGMNQIPTGRGAKTERMTSTRQAVCAVVVAAILLAAAVFVLLERDRAEDSGLWIPYVNLNFFNHTVYPPTDGYILWAIAVDFRNDGDQSVNIDPCEFIVETSDGQLHHFAWRYGNLTGIVIGVEYISGMPAELPPEGFGHIWAPYELAEYTYPTRVIWKSTLGHVLSRDFGEWGQQRLNDFLEG